MSVVITCDFSLSSNGWMVLNILEKSKNAIFTSNWFHPDVSELAAAGRLWHHLLSDEVGRQTSVSSD